MGSSSGPKVRTVAKVTGNHQLEFSGEEFGVQELPKEVGKTPLIRAYRALPPCIMISMTNDI